MPFALTIARVLVDMTYSIKFKMPNLISHWCTYNPSDLTFRNWMVSLCVCVCICVCTCLCVSVCIYMYAYICIMVYIIVRMMVNSLGDQGSCRSMVRRPESTCERRDRG